MTPPKRAKPTKMKRSDATRRAFARRSCRRAAALLVLFVLLASFLSCGGRKETVDPADEGEALAAAENLIAEARPWIRLFFTEGGMPFLANGRTVGVYREVDGAEMEKYGFGRLSDLKAFEKRLFSPSMCERFDAVLFSGGAGWNAALIENTERDYSSGEGKTVFVCFLASPDELPMLPGGEANFDFTRARVKDNRGDRVKVVVPATGVGENEGKTVEKILDLCKIDGVWYLDNYPNVVFPKGDN